MSSRFRWMFAAIVSAAALVPTAYAQRGLRVGPPEATKVTTKDGVELSITYYPGPFAKDPALGKQATPVVLLHGEKDTQSMFSSLAKRLQSTGQTDKSTSFAVVTVDLRGHGASTRQKGLDGQNRQVDVAKLSRKDILSMSALDMEAVRSFLVRKNDAGELNLNKLCLVGVGLGATVAVNWAAQDWSAPPLLVGKQGQDVKALVLVSPQWKYRGVMLQQALRLPAIKKNIAWMLVYGEQSSDQAADAKRIYRQLERFHPEPTSQQRPPRGLVQVPLDSALEGSGLMSQVGDSIEASIVDFLTVHVADREWTWTKRRKRLE